jgi:hypothetical protein
LGAQGSFLPFYEKKSGFDLAQGLKIHHVGCELWRDVVPQSPSAQEFRRIK